MSLFGRGERFLLSRWEGPAVPRQRASRALVVSCLCVVFGWAKETEGKGGATKGGRAERVWGRNTWGCGAVRCGGGGEGGGDLLGSPRGGANNTERNRGRKRKTGGKKEGFGEVWGRVVDKETTERWGRGGALSLERSLSLCLSMRAHTQDACAQKSLCQKALRPPAGRGKVPRRHCRACGIGQGWGFKGWFFV